MSDPEGKPLAQPVNPDASPNNTNRPQNPAIALRPARMDETEFLSADGNPGLPMSHPENQRALATVQARRDAADAQKAQLLVQQQRETLQRDIDARSTFEIILPGEVEANQPADPQAGITRSPFDQFFINRWESFQRGRYSGIADPALRALVQHVDALGDYVNPAPIEELRDPHFVQLPPKPVG